MKFPVTVSFATSAFFSLSLLLSTSSAASNADFKVAHGFDPQLLENVLNKRATSLTTTTKLSTKASSVAGTAASVKPTPSSSPCPAIWATVAADLRPDFANCSQKAANAIRFAFHDAAVAKANCSVGGYSSKTTKYGAASGGADGSLLLNDTEIARAEHSPMQGYRRYLLAKYLTYQPKGVSAADFVQFASSLGVSSCAGGPVFKTVVGRVDDARAAPEGLLPSPFGAGAAYDVLIQLFADKGFAPRELAALMGAHSVSHAFLESSNGIPANGPQDSTPETFDILYYSETQAKVAPDGVYRFDSDVNLANSSTVSGKAFTEFAKSRGAWVTAFSAAMYKLSILGIPQSKSKGFIDCTASIPSHS